LYLKACTVSFWKQRRCHWSQSHHSDCSSCTGDMGSHK